MNPTATRAARAAAMAGFNTAKATAASRPIKRVEGMAKPMTAVAARTSATSDIRGSKKQPRYSPGRTREAEDRLKAKPLFLLADLA